MHPLIASLVETAPVVTDGAWGTQLQSRGLPLGACPDEWNLSHPDAVESVARAYVEAGSAIILTNTFGANHVRLREFSLHEKAANINRAGVKISKRAANGKALVFASIGPSGQLLAMGDVSESELEEAFCEQAEALAAGGADALVIETMSDLEEVALALRAARNTGLPVVACMTYDSGADGDRTMMGTTPEEATATLMKLGGDVIGANCGNGIEKFIPICQRLRAATALPLWIKANAGLPEMESGQAVYRMTPGDFAAHGPALVQAGATFVGGCCGTSPEHIRALRAALKS
jgi:5-methyltetrahydrofolate--homocysteine methyltransferase